MNPASITRLDLVLAAPEIFLLTAVCVILLVDLFLDDERRIVTFVLSLVALAGAAWVTARTGVDARTVAWHGNYVADPLATLLKVVAYGAVAVVFLYSYGYLYVRRLIKGEFFVLGLFALLGIMVLISANSLVTLYLGVELLTRALLRRRRSSISCSGRSLPGRSSMACPWFTALRVRCSWGR